MSVNEVRNKIIPDSEAFVVRGSGYPATNRTFCIGNEDHTIGNAIRHVLIRNSDVSFAGYSVPHPSEPVVQIRIQTHSNNKTTAKQSQSQQSQQSQQSSGSGHVVTALDALRQACQTLADQCDIVNDQLEELLPEVRADRLRMERMFLESEANNGGMMEEDVEDHGDDDVEY